jgi:hypothetical protein
MSWLYSQALVAEYSEGICSDGEPYAPSSGNPTQPVFSSADKTTVFSRRSLSGMTFRRLTESSGEAVLMSFLEAFPVRTYLAPEKAQESTERDLPCGDIWQESSVKFDLERYLWKTALCLWEEDLPESSVILPKWGMMRSGVCWEQSTPVRLTRGIGSGLWGSPNATDANPVTGGNLYQTSSGTVRARNADGSTSQRGLIEQVRAQEKWATPTTMDSLPPKSEKALLREATEVRPGRSKPGNLRDQVSNMKKWPTPRACMTGAATRERLNDKHLNLEKAVAMTMWATPSANKTTRSGELVNANGSPWDGQSKPHSKNTGQPVQTALTDQVARETTGGQLNPTWVEWLMGWPLGWTDLKPLATDKFHQWQHSHGIPLTTFKKKP